MRKGIVIDNLIFFLRKNAPRVLKARKIIGESLMEKIRYHLRLY